VRILLSRLKQVKPQRVYVACDGPRELVSSDYSSCQLVRQLLSAESEGGSIDWDCVVQQRFLSDNHGCRRAVTEAIDWFFSNEEEGIILEDDVLPDITFFSFCEELLEKFRYDLRIGSVVGNSMIANRASNDESYYFSSQTHVWGWASWANVWKFNKPMLDDLESFIRDNWLEQIGGTLFQDRWASLLEAVNAGKIDTWDMIWQYSFWSNNLLAATPYVQLVENIGFDSDATHTVSGSPPLRQVEPMLFPIVHPKVIRPNLFIDKQLFDRFYRPGLIDSMLWRAKRISRLIYATLKSRRSGS